MQPNKTKDNGTTDNKMSSNSMHDLHPMLCTTGLFFTSLSEFLFKTAHHNRVLIFDMTSTRLPMCTYTCNAHIALRCYKPTAAHENRFEPNGPVLLLMGKKLMAKRQLVLTRVRGLFVTTQIAWFNPGSKSPVTGIEYMQLQWFGARNKPIPQTDGVYHHIWASNNSKGLVAN